MSTVSRRATKASMLETVYAMVMCSIIASLFFTAPMLPVMFLALYMYSGNSAYLIFAVGIVSLAFMPKFECSSIRKSWVFLCIAKYFEAEIIHDVPMEGYKVKGNPFLIALVPHGIISFGGLSAGALDPDFYGPTAVADVVQRMPLLRQVFGIFGIISADKEAIHRTLTVTKRSVIVYTGGIAELFLSMRNKEEIYLRKRKGFIRAAMSAGVEIIPVYVFGNTQMYEISRARWLRALSRNLRMSLCLYWGQFCFIPFRAKVRFVVGQPIDAKPEKAGAPTEAEIECYHKQFIDEITRLFNFYKRDLPQYVNKTLCIR